MQVGDIVYIFNETYNKDHFIYLITDVATDHGQILAMNVSFHFSRFHLTSNLKLYTLSMRENLPTDEEVVA